LLAGQAADRFRSTPRIHTPASRPTCRRRARAPHAAADKTAISTDHDDGSAAKLRRPLGDGIMRPANGTRHKAWVGGESSSDARSRSGGHLACRRAERVCRRISNDRRHSKSRASRRSHRALILHPPRRTLLPAFQRVRSPGGACRRGTGCRRWASFERLGLRRGNESERMGVNVDVPEVFRSAGMWQETHRLPALSGLW